MRIVEEYKVVDVSVDYNYGTKRVIQVQHWNTHELTGESSIWDWPTWAHYDEEKTAAYNENFVELAKKIARVDHLRTRFDRGDDDWHLTYLDYAKVVEPGIVEIRTVEPYLD